MNRLICLAFVCDVCELPHVFFVEGNEIPMVFFSVCECFSIKREGGEMQFPSV